MLLVALIGGSAAASTSSARRQFSSSYGSAKVAVRWPLMASIWLALMPAIAIAVRMQRTTPSGLGAVIEPPPRWPPLLTRSEEHTSELQSLMRISYYVF